jgi:V-type H+-transporting ATPase subunit H
VLFPCICNPITLCLTADDGAELAEILSRDIPWEVYMTARLIADKDLQLIRRYDKRSEELQASLLDESGPAYIEAFLTVLRNVTKEETVQYILALLLQMLRANPARAALFHQVGEAHAAAAGGAAGQTDLNPYVVLLRLLQRADWFTQEKSCKLLTLVIAARPHRDAPFVHIASSSAAAAAGNNAASGPGDPAEPHITSFVEWLCGQLRRPSNPTKSVPTAISALAVLLRDKATRGLFTSAGGVVLLAPLLRSCTGPTSSQLAYEICLCVWQLSYHKPALQALASSGEWAGPGVILLAVQEACRVYLCRTVYALVSHVIPCTASSWKYAACAVDAVSSSKACCGVQHLHVNRQARCLELFIAPSK